MILRVIVSFCLFFFMYSTSHCVQNEKVCLGTKDRFSFPSNRTHHYKLLQDRYMNCTHVNGNLELTWLKDENLDFSFLKDIQEVTGYVLISHVDTERLVLPKLMIIRGLTLFKLRARNEQFALLVTLSNFRNLEMPSLRDILSGSVAFYNNFNLCNMKRIKWEEIINGPDAKFIHVYNFTQPERECPPCDVSCQEGCWGEGPHNCQLFSKVNCSLHCPQVSCFGPGLHECCHPFCAGGCTGPTASDCLACQNCNNDGSICAKDCPGYLIRENGACVNSWSSNKISIENKCEPDGRPCAKICKGVDVIHAGNINSFKGCTVIEGSLSIHDMSFNGFQEIYPNFTFGPLRGAMHPSKLEVFSTLKEISGFLNVDASHSHFTNLSYFRNLETIGGQQLTEYNAALYIVKSSLQSLNMHSLKKVKKGQIFILENPNLCFVSSINWQKIKHSDSSAVFQERNADINTCETNGLVCDVQCSKDGCWGVGPKECLSCAFYRLQDTCIENCSISNDIYDAGNGECKQHDEQCFTSCFVKSNITASCPPNKPYKVVDEDTGNYYCTEMNLARFPSTESLKRSSKSLKHGPGDDSALTEILSK